MKKCILMVLIESLGIATICFFIRDGLLGGGDEKLCNLFFPAVMLGMSIGGYLIIHEYNDYYYRFKILSLTYIFRNMCIIITFLTKWVSMKPSFRLVNISLQSTLIQLWGAFLCYLLIIKKMKYKRIVPIANLGFVFWVGIVMLFPLNNSLHNEKEIVMIIEGLPILISIISISIAVAYRKYFPIKSYTIFIHFLNYQLLFGIVNFCLEQGVAISYLENLFYILGTLEACYLFKCIYLVFIKEPWEERVVVLSHKEEQITNNVTYRDMIVNLSHELKTPINVINSATDLLKLDFEQNVELLHEIKSMRRHCDNIFIIVRNMIDLNKLQGGYIKLKYEKYNLVDLMDHVVEAYSGEYPESNLIFNPQQEEIYKCIDKPFMQYVFMYFIYCILQTKQSQEEVMVEMQKESKSDLIEIKISHPCVKHIEYYVFEEEKLQGMLNENKYMESIMAMQLIYELLKRHQAYTSVVKEDGGATIRLVFESDSEDDQEEMILQEENIEELRGLLHSYFVFN